MPAAAEEKSHDVSRTPEELQADRELEQEILARENRIILSREQFEHILELIENPPEPNGAMLEAVALHRKMVRA